MEEKIIREGFIVYRSFIESLNNVSDEEFGKFFRALAWYGLDGVVPELDGLYMSLFISFKAQIDANNRRYINGKKGGAPVGNSNAKKVENNQKQPKTTKNNQKQPKEKDKVKEKEKDNVKDNDNDNVKEKEYTPEGANMIHDDLQQRIVSELNHNEPIPHYYFKYLDKWVDDYGADFVADAINGLSAESKSLTGLMIEVTARARKGTH